MDIHLLRSKQILSGRENTQHGMTFRELDNRQEMDVDSWFMIVNGLVSRKHYRKPLYLMGTSWKIGVACRFSLKPIRWMIGVYWFITSLTAIASFFWNLSLLNPEELIELMPWIRFSLDCSQCASQKLNMA